MSALMAAMWPSIETSIDELMRNYPQSLKDAFNIREVSSVEAYVDMEMLSLILPLAMAFPRRADRCPRDLRGGRMRASGHAPCDAAVACGARHRDRRRVGTGRRRGPRRRDAADVDRRGGARRHPAPAVLVRGMANVWPLSAFFAGIAALAAGRLHRAAPVTAIATGTLVAMYVVDLVARMSGSLGPFRAVSAVRYYGSAVQDGIDVWAFAGLTLAGVALAAIGAALFERRDVL